MRSNNKHPAGRLIFALVIASATLACSLASRISGSLPQPLAGVNGRIVYAGTDGNIYTIDQKGEHQTAITKDANVAPQPGESKREYLYPTWSPDSRRLAFVEINGSGGQDLKASLVSVETSSAGEPGEPTEVFSSTMYFPFYLYWSPDSLKISFLSNGVVGEDLILHLANADGSGHEQVDTGQPYYWAWSPDNGEIFVHTGGAAIDNPTASLALITMAAPFDRRDVKLKPQFFQAPAWSPDGKNIAVAVGGESGDNLVLESSAGGGQRNLAPIEGKTTFAWSPDGRYIAYTTAAKSGSPGEQDLYVLDPDHPQNKSRLASGLIFGFFWSPDSQELAVIKPILDNPDNNGTLSISSASSSAAIQEPKLTLSLQDITVENGKSRFLVSFNPTDSFLNLLPFYDQYQRSMTLWSPDSKALVISGINDQGEPGIYVIDALAGGGKQIADGDIAFWSWK